jgi:D-arabinose 1-dehydrogenase-like Zn-dependent alcohol dehydrogenase
LIAIIHFTIQGKYQFKPTPPFTPGGEVAGVVAKIGCNVFAIRPDLKIGAPVLVQVRYHALLALKELMSSL